MSKNEIINNLNDLSQWLLEIACDLERGKIDINDVPKYFMDIVGDYAKESEVE